MAETVDFTIEIHTPYTDAGQHFAMPGSALPGFVDTWERTENEWGFFQGWATVHEGDGVDFAKLLKLHGDLLGYEVRELMGTAVFEGYINETRLYREGDDVLRVFGYDVGGRGDEQPGMFNAVRVQITNLVENPEFEEDGAGPPTFAYWSEVIGGGDSISQETTDPIKHGQSPKLTNGGSGSTYLYQDVTVLPNTNYKVSFVSCGDGTVDGRYQLRDHTNGADIVPLTSTGNTGLGQFRTVTEEFVTPAGCTTLRIMFHAPSASGWAIFDSVRAQRVADGRDGESYTSWATQDESVARHGRREITLDGRERSPLQAALYRDTFLARRAWPVERQMGGDGETRLEVYVNGYIHRAAWIETDSDTDGITDTIANHVESLAGKLDWVKLIVVDANANLHTMSERRQTVLDALRELMDDGDDDSALWRIYVDADRTLYYRKVDFAPRYALSGGTIYPHLGARKQSNQRLLRAMSVVRNFDFPDSSLLPGSLLQQRNDSLIESVTIGPNGLKKDMAEL